jgi:hypothetical protein
VNPCFQSRSSGWLACTPCPVAALFCSCGVNCTNFITLLEPRSCTSRDSVGTGYSRTQKIPKYKVSWKLLEHDSRPLKVRQSCIFCAGNDWELARCCFTDKPYPSPVRDKVENPRVESLARWCVCVLAGGVQRSRATNLRTKGKVQFMTELHQSLHQTVHKLLEVNNTVHSTS